MRKIDLRSDTVTKPTQEMRLAMMNAEVGDDVYGDDPTVNRLERRAAELVGKEDALFVASGTMGNVLAVMSHTKRGDEIIAAVDSHVVQSEVGASALLAGACVHSVNNPDGMVYPKDVLAGIRTPNIHYPETGLLCMENALGNGRVVPLAIMEENYNIAHGNGFPVHLDGARLFNAALRLGVPASKIASYADSVMFCLSKGLGAPVGSILAGPAGFIEKARKNRKVLGGGMRQAGVLAAPALVALDSMVQRLQIDHDNAQYLAQKLAAMDGVVCRPEDVEINMVFFSVEKPGFHTPTYMEAMEKNGILVNEELSPGVHRILTHYEISREDIDRFLSLFAAHLQAF